MAPYEVEDQIPIILNNCRFFVYPNLLDGIRRFQSVISSDSGQVSIWIDAICINQNDPSERATQVGIMDHIYTKAGLVFVWLGKEDQYTHAAVRLLEAVNNMPEDRREMLRAFQSSMPRKSEVLQACGLPPVDDDKWKCLGCFLRARWFNRIWVIQELALSKQNILFQGAEAFEWSDLTNGISHLASFLGSSVLQSHKFGVHKLDGLLKGAHWINDIEWMRSQVSLYTGVCEPTSTTILMALVIGSQNASATDPRDKVYGLLGIVNHLVSERHIGGMKKLPDYAENNTATAVFKGLMQEVISETKSLTILGAICGGDNERLDDLPSWAIDFLMGESDERLLAIQPSFEASTDIHDPATNVAGHLIPMFYFDNNRLRVRSSVLGKISALRWTREDMFDANLLMQLESLPRLYRFNGESMVEAFWRTSLANAVNRQYPAEWADATSGDVFQSFVILTIFLMVSLGELTIPRSFQILDRLAEIDLDGHLPSSHQLELIGQDNYSEATRRGDTSQRVDDFQHQSSIFADAVRVSMTQSRIVESDEGHLALAPKSSQIGDSIALLEGCRIPLVLRPHPQHSNSFIIIGSAYVHGVMYGEAVSSSTEWKEIWIV